MVRPPCAVRTARSKCIRGVRCRRLRKGHALRQGRRVDGFLATDVQRHFNPKKGFAMSRFLPFIVTIALSATVAVAADFQLKSLDIRQPFARATPPGAKAAGVFMTIQNRGNDADRLVSASSPVAGVVQIHDMKMDGGMMKMREINGLDIKPGATVELKPGGYHVMLMELKQPLKQGETVPVTLRFEKAGTVEIKASIGSMGADHVQ